MWRKDRPVLEGHAGAAGSVEEFEAVYLDAGGLERRVPWAWMPGVLGELGRPVRSFPSYRGQRNFPGWYWCATLGRLIGFESWVARDHLVALDIDPQVAGIVSQPFWLVWPSERGRPRRHAPDFLVRLTGGGVLVVDSRPLALIELADREEFDAADRACALLGWRYAVWGRLDGVVVANHRWLAGYRHPRCFNAEVATRLAEVFTRPRPLMDGAELAGDPLGTLPVLYHLLWKRQLLADMSLVLSHRTLVRTGSPPAGVAKVADRAKVAQTVALTGGRDG
jgi:hypothetical protein